MSLVAGRTRTTAGSSLAGAEPRDPTTRGRHPQPPRKSWKSLVASDGLTLALHERMMQAGHTSILPGMSTQRASEVATISKVLDVDVDVVALLGVSHDEVRWLARGPEGALPSASVIRCVRSGATKPMASTLLNGFELRHPNLMEVRRVFQSEAGPCVVTEYVESVTLADVLSVEEPMPPGIAFRVFADAARGLQVLHTMRLSCEGIPYLPLAHGRFVRRSIAIGLDGITRVDDALGTLVRKLCGDTTTLDVASSLREQRADVSALGELLWDAISHGTSLDYARHPSEVRSDVPRELGDLIVTATGRRGGGFTSANELFYELTTLASKYRTLASATEVSGYALHAATVLASRKSNLRKSRDEIVPPAEQGQAEADEVPLFEPEVHDQATVRLDARALLSIGERLGAWEAEETELAFATTRTMPMLIIEELPDLEPAEVASPEPASAEVVEDATRPNLSRDAARETIRFAAATDAAREGIRVRSQLPTLQFRAIRPVRGEWGWRRWISVIAATAIVSALAGLGGAKLVNHLAGGSHQPHYPSAAVRSLLLSVAGR